MSNLVSIPGLDLGVQNPIIRIQLRFEVCRLISS